MAMDGAPDFLRFANIQKSYDQKTLVVKDFNLDVAKGEFLTLLGPSGSGKTTLLMVLAGFTRPDKGSLKFGEEEMIRTVDRCSSVPNTSSGASPQAMTSAAARSTFSA